MLRNVLIVGAGPAGLAAAEAAADHGAAVTLCGAEPYPPYYRPRLTGYLSKPVPAELLAIRKPDWYGERGIALQTGVHARRIDAARKVVIWQNGEETPWDTLVLAMGASPNVPDVAGVERPYVLRGYDDAVTVRRAALKAGRAVVVGGGLLGLEVAWELRAAGVDATLVERSPWLMPRQLNREGGYCLKCRLESSGLRLIIGQDPSTLASLYEGACVLLCAGVHANLSAIVGSLVEAGRAIVVDDRMRTSVAGIYACGDVAEYNGRNWGLISVAQQQGKIAGANAAGADVAYVETPPSPMLKVGAHAVFSVGDVSEGEGVVALSEENDSGYVCLMLRDDVLVGAVLIGNTAAGGKLKRAVGEKRKIPGVRNVHDAVSML